MKILVTGGGGFVGLALVRRLVEKGHEVSSFSRNIYAEHQQLGIKSFQGDLSNFLEIENACKGIDVVFHVAAKVGVWGSFSDFYNINVTGTKNVISACKKQGVGKLIFTSSASVVFDGTNLEGVDESMNYPKKSISNYTSTKAEAEQLILKANCDSLKTIALRPHLIWGPGDTQLIPKIMERAKFGKLWLPGSKDFKIDTTYIDNFIDAQLLALKKTDENPGIWGKVFFITNDEPVLIWDFLNAIIQSAGFSPSQKRVPKKLALFIAWLLENIHILFRFEKEPYVTRFLIHELCTHHWFNISAAKGMLHYRPGIDYKLGMKKIEEYFKMGIDFENK